MCGFVGSKGFNSVLLLDLSGLDTGGSITYRCFLSSPLRPGMWIKLKAL